MWKPVDNTEYQERIIDVLDDIKENTSSEQSKVILHGLNPGTGLLQDVDVDRCGRLMVTGAGDNFGIDQRRRNLDGTFGVCKDGYRVTNWAMYGSLDETTLNDWLPLKPGIQAANQPPYIPTAPVQIQITSTSVNDALAGSHAQTVLVFGYDATFAEQAEVVNLNGQTPVTTTNAYIRVLFVRVINSLNTGLGTITDGYLYICPSGTAVTAGVPNDATQIIGACRVGEGISRIPYLSFPPGAQIYPTELTILLDTKGNTNSYEFALFVNNSAQPGWIIAIKVYADSSGNNTYSKQEGFPNLNSDQSGLGITDLLLVARDVSGNNSNELGVAFSGAFVMPA